MEKVLNQEEIDAMVRQARSGGAAESALPAQPRVELWDVRRAGQIGREQLQAITTLHEGFARNLTHALGAYLRVVFSCHADFRGTPDLSRIPAGHPGDDLSGGLPVESSRRQWGCCNWT